MLKLMFWAVNTLNKMPFPEEVLLAEEDQNAEEKSPLDGAWYKRKQNNPGKRRVK